MIRKISINYNYYNTLVHFKDKLLVETALVKSLVSRRYISGNHISVKSTTGKHMSEKHNSGDNS